MKIAIGLWLTFVIFVFGYGLYVRFLEAAPTRPVTFCGTFLNHQHPAALELNDYDCSYPNVRNI